MKPYIHICQNNECEAEMEVEIDSFTPDDPGVWADAWEDSTPSYDGEVWYDLPVCPQCSMKQVDSKKIYEKIFNHCLDYYADGDF